MKIYAYLGVLFVVSSAFFATYQAGKISERVLYLKSINDLEASLDRLQQEKQNTVNSITELWLNKKPEIEVRYEKIKSEVIKYTENNTSCNYSIGAAKLFDNVGRNTWLQENKNTEPTNGEKGNTSNISKRDTTLVCIGWAKEYYKTVDQLHTLQKVVSNLPCVSF